MQTCRITREPHVHDDVDSSNTPENASVTHYVRPSTGKAVKATQWLAVQIGGRAGLINEWWWRWIVYDGMPVKIVRLQQ